MICINNKPNILLIFCDQLRYDCIGFSSEYPVKTPNIDRIASEGMWFENTYTPIPLCCPARQSLLNGRRPEAFGALWNYGIALKIPALEPTEYSWPRNLKNSGYKTGYVGKWHVNPEYNPTFYGFEDYVSEENYEDYLMQNYPHIEFENSFFGEASRVPVDGSRTHWFADRAIDLIKKYQNEDYPWHLRLDFPEPHLPCHPSGKFSNMYKSSDVQKWKSFNDNFINKPYIQKQQLYNWNIENYTWEDWAPIVARYYAIISQMDNAIGKVLNELERMGILNDTMIIFTADHGDMCGGHRMMDKHFIMYEDVVKVPLAIRWPKYVNNGTRCKEYIYNCLDIPPTILDILGIESKGFFDGRSFKPLLEGHKVHDWRDSVVSTYNGNQFGLYTQRMLKTDRWKYVWNNTDIDELYNLEADPGELDNLAGESEYNLKLTDLRRKLYYELVKIGDGLVRWPSMGNQLLDNKKLWK